MDILSRKGRHGKMPSCQDVVACPRGERESLFISSTKQRLSLDREDALLRPELPVKY